MGQQGEEGFPWLPTCNGAVKRHFPHYFNTQLHSERATFERICAFFCMGSARLQNKAENIKNRGAGKINDLDSTVHMLLVLCWNGNIQALFPKEAISSF